jgi:predicted porin
MYGGVWGASFALALGMGLSMAAAPTRAADLGGDCCADLEERVAELEATTARKGNRKVSLTVSGWVNEAVFFWDDGTERNVYVGTNKLEQSRFKFAGEAKIDKDLSAGYTLEIGVVANDSGSWDQDSPSRNSGVFTLRKSNWWVKSKTYGKLTVGLEGTSTYHLLDDADFTQTRSFADALGAGVALGSFRTRSNGAVGPRWSEIMRGYDNSTPGQSGRRNIVRYDSPEFGGFVATASWGEDDLWDVALIYKGEFKDFKLAGRIGYGNSTDPTASNCGGTAVDFECEWGGAAATLQHTPTGLYLYGGYGQQTIKSLPGTLDKDSTTWFVQPGIEKKWNDLGKTTVFGEYRHDEAGANQGTSLGADLTFWAAGVAQGIEKADMLLYALYRHGDGEYVTAAGALTKLDDFDLVITGAKLNF